MKQKNDQLRKSNTDRTQSTQLRQQFRAAYLIQNQIRDEILRVFNVFVGQQMSLNIKLSLQMAAYTVSCVKRRYFLIRLFEEKEEKNIT